jgi:hypothetical protein
MGVARWVPKEMDGIRQMVAKLVALLLATAALWVRILTSLKNTKWETKAMECPTNHSPPKNITNKMFEHLVN